MYRGTWLLVGIPLLIAAFTVFHPQPLPAPTLQPDFDGASARLTAEQFANNNPDRVPGTAGARRAASWVAQRLNQYGLELGRERFHAKIPGRGNVELENLIAVRQGRSNQLVVVVAHRDNTGASPGANDNGSGTAALLELARSYATPQAPPRPPQPNHSILFLSSDAGSYGGLGVEHFITHYRYRDRVVAVVDLDSIAGTGRPHLVFSGDTPKFASAVLVRTAAARLADQTGVEPTWPRSLSQLLDLAFPLSLYEQAPFVAHGVAAVALTSGGDRPPPAFGDTPDRLNGARLTRIGRSGQALLESLDDDVELAEGTSSYIYLGARAVRGWAIVLILVTAMLPALAVIVDLFARLRRRHIALAPALRSYRTRLLFWLFAVLLFELFAFLGAWATGAARPLSPELSPGTQWPVLALAAYGCLLALGWLVGRDRLVPRRPLGDGEELSGQVGALLVLAGRRDAHQPEQPVGRAVEEGDRPGHDPGEAHQRRRHPRAHRLGVEQGERLGHQLAQDDVQDGDDDEGDDRRDAVRGDGRQAAGSQRKPPSISPASAGSPIQPRPSEASVMPSCVAEM